MFVDGELRTAGPMDRLTEGPRGVRRWEPDRCWEGFTLFSQAFGDAVYLMDMDGRVVLEWSVSSTQYAELLPSGNLMVDEYDPGTFENNTLSEIEPDGTVVWRWAGEADFDRELESTYHHDFDWVDEDTVVFLARVEEEPDDRFYEDGEAPARMLTDLILMVDRESGEVVWSFSFGDHLDELSELSGLPLPVPYEASPAPADWAHTNTVQVLPETPAGEADDRFRAGNLLVSFRSLDVVAVVDPDRDELVWCWGLGTLDGQHQPQMLSSGNILVFDNGTYRGESAVLELDPLSEEVVWSYRDGAEFFSPYRAGQQRLPNGNTLIAESDAGHLFEVTPEGDVVWDFYTPFLGRMGQSVYRANRYSRAYVEPVLEAHEETVTGTGDADREPITDYAEVVDHYYRPPERWDCAE